jgi:hypothetical protein
VSNSKSRRANDFEVQKKSFTNGRKNRLETAWKLIEEDDTLEKIIRITGLSKDLLREMHLANKGHRIFGIYAQNLCFQRRKLYPKEDGSLNLNFKSVYFIILAILCLIFQFLFCL